MRRGFSPSKSKVLEEISFRQDQEEKKIPINRAADYKQYFCHYNNAVYMGGMSSYKKHGKGLLLHDDGSAAITEYLHDTPAGHTIIFRENSITSVLYKSNVQFEVAYKQGKYIIIIPFTDSSFKASGIGVLVDYSEFKIYRLTFKKGSLVEKVMHLDKRDSEDVFYRNTGTKIIATKHEDAFNVNFQKPNRVEIKHEQHKTTIGYFDQDGAIHGLAFSFYRENIRTSGQKSLYLKFIEKGYYRNSSLQTFGEKLFRNGNKYIGEFDNHQFHGHGILICPSQMKWVYGKFNQGEMTEIINSNHKKFTEQQFQVWAQSLREIHRRYKQRWIDIDIDLPEQNYLYNTLKSVAQSPITYVDPDKKELVREEQLRMNRIQEQFQKYAPGTLDNSYVQKELDRHFYLKKELQSSKKLKKREQLHMPSTHITKFGVQNQKANQHIKTQRQYRQQDPFKLALSKIPVNTSTKASKEPVILKSKVQARLPFEQPLSRNSRQKYLPSSYEPLNYGYRSKYLPHLNSIHNSDYMGDLRQKQRWRRIQDDQFYIGRLRRGLETSPVHRNYYSTPTKYEQIYPERYSGKLTSKRNYDYEEQEPSRKKQVNSTLNSSKKYPKEEMNIYSSNRADSPQSLYKSPTGKRNKSPKAQLQQSYDSKKQTPSQKEQSQSRKHTHNPQYWRTKF